MLDRFCKTLMETLQATQASYAEKLTSGKLQDYAMYKYYAGLMEGNKAAQKQVREVYDFFTEPQKHLKSKMEI